MKPVTQRHQNWILADGHVHIYRHFADFACLDWALRNFAKAADSLQLSAGIGHVLFLTETSNDNWFLEQRHLARKKPQTGLGNFQRVITNEDNSLVFTNTSGKSLTVIAGRQILTAERIEVLAFGLDEAYPDGLPLQKVLFDVNEKNCIAVLPWGVGKWLGKRGKILASLFESPENIFRADSGNRPFFWPLPGFFHSPSVSSRSNFAGSDPLPLANQERRIGTYGFVLQCSFDQANPFTSFREAITQTCSSLQVFGKPARLFAFLSHQLAMRFKSYNS
jgi:hypothetical protein